jgi:hypothetical protein
VPQELASSVFKRNETATLSCFVRDALSKQAAVLSGCIFLAHADLNLEVVKKQL